VRIITRLTSPTSSYRREDMKKWIETRRRSDYSQAEHRSMSCAPRWPIREGGSWRSLAKGDRGRPGAVHITALVRFTGGAEASRATYHKDTQAPRSPPPPPPAVVSMKRAAGEPYERRICPSPGVRDPSYSIARSRSRIGREGWRTNRTDAPRMYKAAAAFRIQFLFFFYSFFFFGSRGPVRWKS